MKQNVAWLGFCTSGTLTRTAVHFFPSAGGVTAPYAAQCKLSIFCHGSERKSVVLDGARLSQPDGVWLDDAFPELRSANGLVGMEVEIHTTQPRVDMSASGCILEFHSGLGLSRYSPVMLDVDAVPLPLPLIKDGFATSSLVIVNGSDAEIQPKLLSSRLVRAMTSEQANCVTSALAVSAIPARSIEEVNLPENFFTEVIPTECSWGLVRLAGVALAASLPKDAVGYVAFRDPVNGQLLSVSAL